jgi:hypothetical protein
VALSRVDQANSNQVAHFYGHRCDVLRVSIGLYVVA